MSGYPPKEIMTTPVALLSTVLKTGDTLTIHQRETPVTTTQTTPQQEKKSGLLHFFLQVIM